MAKHFHATLSWECEWLFILGLKLITKKYGLLIIIGSTPGGLHAVIWWRHQMETFSALLALYAGDSPITGEFPAQSPETRSFDVFFDLRLIKRFSKQSRGWRVETPVSSLWRDCSDLLQWHIMANWILRNKPSLNIKNKFCSLFCLGPNELNITVWTPYCSNYRNINLKLQNRLKQVLFKLNA